MKVRLRLHRLTPALILAGLLCLALAWLLAQDYEVPAAGRLIWGGYAAGVLLGIAIRIEQIRRGWLPKRDKVRERFFAWRIGFPLALFMNATVRLFHLYWVPVVAGGMLAGLFLPFIVKPDLPEREVRGWWR